MNSCMISALTASVMSPLRAPTDTKNRLTAIRHALRRNMSALMPKKRRNSAATTTVRSPALRSKWPWRRTMMVIPNAMPVYSAMTVPTGIPAKPISKAYTARRLAAMLATLMPIAISMGVRESCMPMNHPFMAMSMSMAGAPHTQM